MEAKTTYYTYKNNKFTLSQLASLPECRIHVRTLYSRLSKGWSVEEAVLTPNNADPSLDFTRHENDKWCTINEFQCSEDYCNYDGWCWIRYEGEVKEAYYRGETFYISDMSIAAYNWNSITHVWPYRTLRKPYIPEDETKEWEK